MCEYLQDPLWRETECCPLCIRGIMGMAAGLFMVRIFVAEFNKITFSVYFRAIVLLYQQPEKRQISSETWTKAWYE